VNIFVTNHDPILCAHEYCRSHNNKIILEISQMLSTAHRLLNGRTDVYKAAYVNHPCTVWVRNNIENYIWTLDHLKELHRMFYTDRGKNHASIALLPAFENLPDNIPDGKLSKHPQCMPEQFHNTDTTLAYQKYLVSKFSEWETRGLDVSFAYGVPKWMN
jgi:hypothetical protein